MKRTAGIIFLVLVSLFLLNLSTAVRVFAASDYPNHPIKMIVGFTPGGPADSASMIIAKKVSEFLSQPMVSEYKPGGGGVLGATFVSKSKPDGYTVCVGTPSPFLIAPLITANLGYTLEEFIPISGYCLVPLMINVKKGGRWSNLKELVEDAKNNPGKYTYTTQGSLTINHFMMEMFSKKAGIKLTYVPFPGAAEANAALLGGHVDISSTGGTSGLYEGGRVIILATGEEKRLKEFPEIPTLTELGYPIVLNSLYFLCAPKGTPQEAIDKLYDAHKKAFAKYGDEIADLLKKFEMYPAYLSPEEVRKQNQLRRDMFRETAKDMGVLVNQ